MAKVANSGNTLLVIDGQKGFMPEGPLAVGSGDNDMLNTANFIGRNGKQLDTIRCTFDTHPPNHISHASWWVNDAGEHPTPGIQISHQDVLDGVWKARGGNAKIAHLGKRTHQDHVLMYTRALEDGGKYTHTIWPNHCVRGTDDTSLQDDLARAIMEWEETFFRNMHPYVKGMDPFFERFGALASEVEEPGVASTMMDTSFVRLLTASERLIIAGEASSHCVRATVDQVRSTLGAEEAKKIIVLKDCMGPVIITDVIDFTDAANAWFAEIEAEGISVMNSTDLDLSTL